ncbi:TetR/AcrR family transcriptional regulator [Yinghuangia sp. YIM S10712]|uniref:TetR/AcrR family transcriptional regulator n=1 Tax=Yinghuangia sp. YIM S10712 TaxID=3436930 RepID=UPI003F5328AB
MPTTDHGSGVRERRSAERRRRIIDEAIEVIGRRGYYGFSIQQVADGCGLTVAGVLHHVGSKDGLLLAVLEDRDERDAEFIAARHDDDTEPRHFRLLGSLRDIVHRNSNRPEIVRLYTMLRIESLDRGHPAHDYFRTHDQKILDALAGALTDAVPEPVSTARQILAMMGGLEEQWLGAEQGFDLLTEWDRAISRIMPGNTPPS